MRETYRDDRWSADCLDGHRMFVRASGPRSGADACHTRSARRSSARASDARALRRARRPEGVRDRELWKSRARLRETALEGPASFGGVAPIWPILRVIQVHQSELPTSWIRQVSRMTDIAHANRVRHDLCGLRALWSNSVAPLAECLTGDAAAYTRVQVRCENRDGSTNKCRWLISAL